MNLSREGRALRARHAGVALVLENVRKENAAMIARTAECLGVPAGRAVASSAQGASAGGERLLPQTHGWRLLSL